ncbi:MAG: cytochrome c oxidase subunit 3 family protein [Gammaproteobacteria bacterium]|nr:cytochrome c oxidase subunit 3 family protein [Gammaproteobacteria bacterium]
MTDASVTSANPVENKGHVPGEVGIWVLVMGDMLVFTLFFCVFLAYRSVDLELYRESRLQLNLHFGMLNTVLLLASSWLVATSIAAFRRRQLSVCKHSMGLAILCGLGFGLIKYFEYSEKFALGITPVSNEFFMFYFVLTGIHFLHLLIGLAVLSYLWLRLRRCGFDKLSPIVMESSATFWHMVDLLWIVLFPLLYLLP